MNISLCITVKNEEKMVGPLLDSIFAGTKKPDEIVIVDGGSTDSTLSVIYNLQFTIYKKFPKIKFKIIKTKNTGIAAGRNLAIKKSMGDVIVQTDAGCIVKKDWLEKITRPFFEKFLETDIVAGYYEMPAKGARQKVLSVYLGIPPQRYNKRNFIPSARSVAFRKDVWKKVGGYNEKLKNTGEDTLFFSEALRNNFKIDRVEGAKVIWEETRNLTFAKAIKKFFNYAKGDSKTKIWWHPTKQLMSHNIKISLIFARYCFGILLVVYGFFYPVIHVLLFILVLLYLLYPICKWRDVITTFQGRLWLPIVQISSDFAVMAGFIAGIYSSCSGL
jgi:glycosyltransferase involved in cell wall biosynthesis